MSHTRRRSLRLFTLFVARVFLLPSLVSAQQPPKDALGDNTVLLTVTVTDAKGRYMTGFGKDNFSVFEDKAQREVSFFDAADEPMSVVLLIDTSASMGRDKIARVKLAVETFIQRGRSENEYLIAEFNNGPRALTDWTSDPRRLSDGLQLIEQRLKTNTALYDACSFALGRLAVSHRRKHVLFVITDGEDNISRTSFKELRRKVQESDALIYAASIVEPYTMGSEGRQAALTELTSQSGGLALFPQTAAELLESAERIAVELQHQYVIGFVPDSGSANASGPRKVKIKLIAPRGLKGMSARAREVYPLPPAKTQAP